MNSGSEKSVDSTLRAGDFPWIGPWLSPWRSEQQILCLGRAPTEKLHAMIPLVPCLCVSVPRVKNNTRSTHLVPPRPSINGKVLPFFAGDVCNPGGCLDDR